MSSRLDLGRERVNVLGTLRKDARRTGRFPQLPHLCSLNGAESGGPVRVDFRGTGRRRTLTGRNHKGVEGSGVPTENTVRVARIGVAGVLR
jgi:hypothetical protein